MITAPVLTSHINSVKAILDANRNSLMLLDLKFSVGTLGIGSGAFVAALYGMNLKNFMEESNLGFWGVTAWSAVFASIIVAYGLVKLRRVQKVSMWGEHGRRGWRNLEDPLADAANRRMLRERVEKVKQLKQLRDVNGARAGTEEAKAAVTKSS